MTRPARQAGQNGTVPERRALQRAGFSRLVPSGQCDSLARQFPERDEIGFGQGAATAVRLSLAEKLDHVERCDPGERLLFAGGVALSTCISVFAAFAARHFLSDAGLSALCPLPQGEGREVAIKLLDQNSRCDEAHKYDALQRNIVAF
jgi:hypothetical protein